ncbi:MAG: hypothetical protein AAB706_01120 [Patescibacteria group bacterium]
MTSLQNPLKTKTNEQKAFIKNAVLSTIGLVGVLSIALVAPNAIQLLKPFLKKRSRNTHIAVNTALNRLLRQEMVYFEKTEKGTFVRLTDKGKIYLETNILKQKKPQYWDGKWRMLIFDIKEHRRGTRDKLRRSLIDFGFKHLQHSVWIYPYDCEDIVVLLKADFKIGKDILYVVAERLENDGWLRKDFGL